MEIALYGSEDKGKLGWMCERGLRQLGHNVSFITQDREVSPLLDRFGVGLTDFRDRVVSECVSAAPDLVLIIKGYDINYHTVQRIRDQTDAVVVNWNPDNPFQVRSNKKIAETHLKSLPAYDIVFTWGESLMGRLRKHGAQRVEHLPFGYDPELHQPLQSSSKYACDVVFLGHWSKKRERILGGLSDLDVDFHLWGNYWKWRCWKPSLRRCLRGNAIFGSEYARAMSSANIVVNVVADHNVPAYNMRTFEVPATRSFMLTTDTEGQQEIFPHGRSAAMYNSPEELAELVSYYLDAEQERRTIARSGYERVQAHSYRARMERLLNIARDVGS